MLTLAAVTTNPLEITFAGVVIAILFLASIVGVLGWMFRLPKETERTRTVARATRSVNKLTHILVPLLSKCDATDRIVALAAQMVRSRNGNVELLAVLEVPFTLPLDAKVEEDEKEALEILDCAESVAKQCVTAVNKRIVKARNAGPAIVREAEMRCADLILMANTPVRVRGNVQQIHPAVDYVMKNAPCEVLVLSQGHVDANHNGVEAEYSENKAKTAGTTR
jgi:nucleotide-binding universal stress UspA family protein